MTELPERQNNNRFQQAQLPSFSPTHSPQAVVPCLIIIAIIFIPIGAAIIAASDKIVEVSVRYDDVKKCTSTSNDGILSFTLNGSTFMQGCTTRVVANFPKAMSAPIYVYYRLTNFYQNYRLFSKSINWYQTQGTSVKVSDLSDCAPFSTPGEYTGEADKSFQVNGQSTKLGSIMYNPCGAIAWSMFNDSISLYKTNGVAVPSLPGTAVPVGMTPYCIGNGFDFSGATTDVRNNGKCTKKGIALGHDVDTRFKQPDLLGAWTFYGSSSTDNAYLNNGFYQGEAGHRVPHTLDEDFMVWARIAGLSDFRKVYRRIDVDIPAGEYLVDIEEKFDTTSFEGQKHVIFATTSWVGGENYALGVAYVVIGSFAFILGIAFLVLHVAKQSAAQQK